LKILDPKIKAGRVAQVVECLPNKCEVLSSKPSIMKRERERKIKTVRLPTLTLNQAYIPALTPGV
jgi:hypothetical protein